MADFSAADVATLRKATGAGMMDCKKALQENGGDLEAAKEWLRKQGLAGAGKRAGRAAEQGAVEVLVEGGVGAIAELTAETDFVAKGADFTEHRVEPREARGRGRQGRARRARVRGHDRR